MLRKTAIGATTALLMLAGCGGGGGDARTGAARDPAAKPPAETRAEPSPEPEPELPLTPSHCPPGLAECRTTEGAIRYVERVDPDGDGDAHFVLDDPQGITVRGLTFVDVRRGLRPHPLPGIGERISAAGPVQTGSYGQSQIHAIELHVAGE